jgi:hypothetical protein
MLRQVPKKRGHLAGFQIKADFNCSQIGKHVLFSHVITGLVTSSIDKKKSPNTPNTRKIDGNLDKEEESKGNTQQFPSILCWLVLLTILKNDGVRQWEG